MKLNKEGYKQVVFILALLLGFFLPHTSVVGKFINGILPPLLFVLLIEFKKIKLNKTALFVIVVIILSFSLNVFLGEVFKNESILRLFSFSFLFLLFPFSPKVNIPNWVLYGSLIYIFISQITYTLGITFLLNFFDTYYPYEGETRGLTSEFLASGAGEMDFVVNRRYGGLYHNPNQAVRYISVLLAVFLVENRNNSFIIKLPFIGLALVSILLSGSRTGLVVALILLMFNYFMLGDKKKFNAAKVFSFVAVFGLLMLIYLQVSGLELRVFNIAEGVDSSIGQKVEWFFSFLKQLDSPIKFFIGHYSTDNIEQYGIPLLDSEWGEAFYDFGLFGVISILIFYVHLYKTHDSNLRFILILLLWGVSSTVLFSFRMSLIFMLILSNYYSAHLLKGNK